jgi:hypothetical protein
MISLSRATRLALLIVTALVCIYSSIGWLKIATYAIVVGFIIVGVGVLSVFIPRSGLNVGIIE